MRLARREDWDPDRPGYTKKGKKIGRPMPEFDWDQFESLCRCQATIEEIAAVMNTPKSTIESRVKTKYKAAFSEVLKRLAGEIQVSLRRRQIQAALNEKQDNNTMLIWLGKQYLGQRDVDKEAADNRREPIVVKTVSYADGTSQTMVERGDSGS